MTKGRVEAFSDGVIAIIITIMVLELRRPTAAGLQDLRPLVPVFLSYVLSFIYVGIYWSNHHHLMHVVRSVAGPILWGNLHLLFWLSLVPFVTSWMGEHPFSTVPVALYGVDLLMNAVAYSILVRLLLKHEGPESTLAAAIGGDVKGNVSLVMYAAGIGLAFIAPPVSIALYVAVAVVWIIPDRRIERALNMR